jgi:hypothetical protein
MPVWSTRQLIIKSVIAMLMLTAIAIPVSMAIAFLYGFFGWPFGINPLS